MSTIQQQIAEKFLAKLEAAKADSERIQQLRMLLASGKKLKVDDLVRAFSSPTGVDVK